MQAHPDVDGASYIRANFKELLGKVYTPFEDEKTYSLALDNAPEHRAYNAELVKTLSKYFYVHRCNLGASPEGALAETKAEGFLPVIEKNGVMMEDYSSKSSAFLTNGRLAVGIKYTRDAMEIIENLHNIGYILFHHRSNEGQHLFPIISECSVCNSEELSSDVYKVIKEKELYITVNINPSAEIPVCHNLRRYANKVFKGVATDGTGTMGWCHGFKLNLLFNNRGEIITYCLTGANIEDRNPKVWKVLAEDLYGKIFADRGYISPKLFDSLFDDGIQLVHGIKTNMKSKLMSFYDKMMLRKRYIIETINDLLKNKAQLVHSRHRSITNFLVNLVAVLGAYCFFDNIVFLFPKLFSIICIRITILALGMNEYRPLKV